MATEHEPGMNRARIHVVPEPWDGFTVGQITYVRHLRAGHTYQQIADAYRVSQGSVRIAVHRVCQVFDCRSAAELVAVAADDGVEPLTIEAPV